MSTEKQMIPFAAAKEYVEVNYPNDPLLRTVAGSLLEALPKVDAVEVVRCKDCRFVIDREDGSNGCYRHFMEECTLNDFCSYGERKPNEQS